MFWGKSHNTVGQFCKLLYKRYCPNIHFRFSISEVSWLKLVVLLEDIWLHIALGNSMGGTSWNAAACVRRSSMSQKVEGPWAQGRAGQMWVAGLCSTRVALATDIPVGPDSLPILFTAVSHFIQVIRDHTRPLMDLIHEQSARRGSECIDR